MVTHSLTHAQAERSVVRVYAEDGHSEAKVTVAAPRDITAEQVLLVLRWCWC